MKKQTISKAIQLLFIFFSEVKREYLNCEVFFNVILRGTESRITRGYGIHPELKEQQTGQG